MRTTNQEQLKRFIEIYYLSPEEKGERGLTTQKAVCKAVGITEPTYKAWAKKAEARRNEFVKDEFDEFIDYMKNLAFNPKSLGKDRELYAKLKGWMIEKREDTVKVEISATDKIKQARELVSNLRAEYERGSGICPICLRPQALHDSYPNTRREQQEDNKVAILGLPAGLTGHPETVSGN